MAIFESGSCQKNAVIYSMKKPTENFILVAKKTDEMTDSEILKRNESLFNDQIDDLVIVQGDGTLPPVVVNERHGTWCLFEVSYEGRRVAQLLLEKNVKVIPSFSEISFEKREPRKYKTMDEWLDAAERGEMPKT